MNAIDNLKLRILIEQSLKCLKFLDLINVQDDISSELAGYQISKLLKDQQNNQQKYAQLVKRRSGLTGIVNKKELQEVEAEIANIATILKQSTKKLCKLFKQNPDLERDSQKVNRERKSLMTKLEQLITHIQGNSTQKFQTFITQQLQSQDQLRRFMEKQKNLNMQIKRLQQEKNLQEREYKKQILENQSKIQEQKQKLMHKTQKAALKINYSQKETAAELSNQKRIFQHIQKELSNTLNHLRSKITVQTQVHKQLKQYLLRKQEQIKKKTDEWNKKFDDTKQTLEKQISQLTESKEKTLNQLSEFKHKYQLQQQRKMERQLEEQNKNLQNQKKQQQRIKIENAIKMIQNEYLAWKEAGGGKKKKKKGGAKKK